MTKWNFMLSWVEHERSFITSRPDVSNSYPSGGFVVHLHNYWTLKNIMTLKKSLIRLYDLICNSRSLLTRRHRFLLVKKSLIRLYDLICDSRSLLTRRHRFLLVSFSSKPMMLYAIFVNSSGPVDQVPCPSDHTVTGRFYIFFDFTVLLAIHGVFWSFRFHCLLSALLCGSNMCIQVLSPVSKLEITRLL